MKVDLKAYKLSPQTMELISRNTRLNQKELTNLPIDEVQQLMIERGAKKKPNPIKVYAENLYQKIGEKLGLIKREHNFYTHVD